MIGVKSAMNTAMNTAMVEGLVFNDSRVTYDQLGDIGAFRRTQPRGVRPADR